MQDTAWLYGGSDVPFPGLTWANRPNVAGSDPATVISSEANTDGVSEHWTARV